MRISDWSSDVCYSDLVLGAAHRLHALAVFHPAPINVMRDVRAADEAYRRNPRMIEDRIDHFLVALHHLKDPFGQPSLEHQFGEAQRHRRIAFRWLENDDRKRTRLNSSH